MVTSYPRTPPILLRYVELLMVRARVVVFRTRWRRGYQVTTLAHWSIRRRAAVYSYQHRTCQLSAAAEVASALTLALGVLRIEEPRGGTTGGVIGNRMIPELLVGG
jgi:hypothetical protein